MAKLKFAFQAEYYKTHRRQLRDYVFGYFHIAAALASSVASISNAVMEIPVFKNLFARLLGITEKRPFPKFSNRRSRLESVANSGKKIIYLSDPFSRYIEPQVEQAAFDILSRAGYDVHVLPVIGAGASFLSKGFVNEASHHAGKLLDALNQIDPARVAHIVGIEPPEVYCLKHDYVDLLPVRASEIEQRAANTWLLDEYLLRSEEFNLLRVVTVTGLSGLDDGLSKSKIQFHPHCHQRAEGPAPDGLPTGTSATVALLRSCGYGVDLLDTGCCGMAGTFGYEAEHYDVSMKVGELKLFPLLRQLREEESDPRRSQNENQKSRIVSSGAACRLQIEQGAGVASVHPLTLIADLLNEVRTDGKK